MLSQLKEGSPPCNQAVWPEELKKAHLGCQIAGIKWLGYSPTACDGKAMHDSSCINKFLCSLINASWKSHQLFMC